MLRFRWTKTVLIASMLLHLSVVHAQLPYSDPMANPYYAVVSDILERDTASLFNSIIPVTNNTHPLNTEMSVVLNQIIEVNEHTQVCEFYE